MNLVGSATAAVRHQLAGTNRVDEWGMDPDAVAVAQALAGLRWSVSVVGAENVPVRGPALLVANRRPLAATPILVATALGRATGRAIRFTGIADIAPAGPLLRRAGGVVARPEEVTGLLRAGEIAATWCPSAPLSPHRVGPAPRDYLGRALALDVPVLPVAVIATALARRVRVEVGLPVAHHTGRGPLATAELADAVRGAIQLMVDDGTHV